MKWAKEMSRTKKWQKNLKVSDTLHTHTHTPPPPHIHTHIFLLGIKGLAVPQESPAAHRILSSQGHWIYSWALWPRDCDYLTYKIAKQKTLDWENYTIQLPFIAPRQYEQLVQLEDGIVWQMLRRCTFSRLTSASTICFSAWRGSEALWCRKWERVSSSRKKSFSLKPKKKKKKTDTAALRRPPEGCMRKLLQLKLNSS